MDRSKHEPAPDAEATLSETAERRRIARIVHDERGNASVVWHDAPSDFERPTLSIAEAPGVETRPLAVDAPQDSFDPYSRPPQDAAAASTGIRKKPTDLRKLSEWIKMMRELEAARKRGE